MNMIMHSFVFVPAVVFGGVAVLCWGFSAVLDRLAPAPRLGRFDRLDRLPPAPVLNTPPARVGFRPVVIQGGLAAATISSLRAPQTPLGSGRAGSRAIHAARSYGG